MAFQYLNNRPLDEARSQYIALLHEQGLAPRAQTIPVPAAAGRMTARLTEGVSANHGRAQYSGALLREGAQGLEALPIRGKSGLITALAGADGYFCIPRDCEGLPAGAQVLVNIFLAD